MIDSYIFDEWQLSSFPSQISLNRLAISGTPIVIARREIFDIRTQLMAEDSADHDNAELIAGLEEGDLKPNFYEGGFKTWECSLDLAKLVASQDAIVDSLGDLQTDVHVIEVCPPRVSCRDITAYSIINDSLEQGLRCLQWLYSLIHSAKQSHLGMRPQSEKRISLLQTTTTPYSVLSHSPISF